MNYARRSSEKLRNGESRLHEQTFQTPKQQAHNGSSRNHRHGPDKKNLPPKYRLTEKAHKRRKTEAAIDDADGHYTLGSKTKRTSHDMQNFLSDEFYGRPPPLSNHHHGARRFDHNSDYVCAVRNSYVARASAFSPQYRKPYPQQSHDSAHHHPYRRYSPTSRSRSEPTVSRSKKKYRNSRNYYESDRSHNDPLADRGKSRNFSYARMDSRFSTQERHVESKRNETFYDDSRPPLYRSSSYNYDLENYNRGYCKVSKSQKRHKESPLPIPSIRAATACYSNSVQRGPINQEIKRAKRRRRESTSSHKYYPTDQGHPHEFIESTYRSSYGDVKRRRYSSDRDHNKYIVTSNSHTRKKRKSRKHQRSRGHSYRSYYDDDSCNLDARYNLTRHNSRRRGRHTSGELKSYDSVSTNEYHYHKDVEIDRHRNDLMRKRRRRSYEQENHRGHNNNPRNRRHPFQNVIVSDDDDSSNYYSSRNSRKSKRFQEDYEAMDQKADLKSGKRSVDSFRHHSKIKSFSQSKFSYDDIEEDYDEDSRSNAGDDSEGHFRGEPGTVIGEQYRILEDVGMGTFGRVVKCYDLTKKSSDSFSTPRAASAPKRSSKRRLSSSSSHYHRSNRAGPSVSSLSSSPAPSLSSPRRKKTIHIATDVKVKRMKNRKSKSKERKRRYSTVAIKIVRNVRRYHEAALIEADILRDVNSKDGRGTSLVVNMLNHFDLLSPSGSRHYCLVFECLGMSLYDFLKSQMHCPFPMYCVRDFSSQLLDALDFLHRTLGLIHTDLKLENILLVSQDDPVCHHFSGGGFTNKHRHRHSSRGTSRSFCWVPASTKIKVIDFGGATYDNDPNKSSLINTRQYRSPEVILNTGWSIPSDLWSVGCIIAELYLGELLFATHDNYEHLALMEAMLGTFPPQVLARARAAQSQKKSSSSSDNLLVHRAFDARTGRLSGKVLSPDKRDHVAHTLTLEETIHQGGHGNIDCSDTTRLLLSDLLRKLLMHDDRMRVSARRALEECGFFRCELL